MVLSGDQLGASLCCLLVGQWAVVGGWEIFTLHITAHKREGGDARIVFPTLTSPQSWASESLDRMASRRLAGGSHGHSGRRPTVAKQCQAVCTCAPLDLPLGLAWSLGQALADFEWDKYTLVVINIV